MKLFILAALIAISSAARLEHLEQQRGLKEYLPPVQGHHQSFGGHGASDFSQTNSLDAGDSAGFGSAPQGLRASSAGARGFSSFEAARSNQYLPPDHGPSGSSGFNRPNSGVQGQDSFGASSNQYGSQSQFGQSNKFGSQGSSSFGSQGSNGFGSQGSNGFGSQESHSGFGSQGSFGSQGGFGSQSGFGSQGTGSGSQGSRGQQNQLRQYLAPKASSSHDNIPQQAFNEQTGYIY